MGITIGETVTVSVERYNELIRAEERVRIISDVIKYGTAYENVIDKSDVYRICSLPLVNKRAAEAYRAEEESGNE